MSGWMEKIGQLAIFIICAQTLLHFRAKESYEKYIKLLVSMMLLILMLEPMMDLFAGKGKKGFFVERIQVYERELTDVMGKNTLSSEQIEEILTGITGQVLEEKQVYEELKEDMPEREREAEKEAEREENERKIMVQEVEKVEVKVSYGNDAQIP